MIHKNHRRRRSFFKIDLLSNICTLAYQRHETAASLQKEAFLIRIRLSAFILTDSDSSNDHFTVLISCCNFITANKVI